MMSRELPARPNLEHLKKQAKDLVRSGGAERLSDAQLTVAREYGFASWTKLKLFVESRSGDPVQALVASVRANDVAQARRLLAQHPGLGARLNDPLPGLSFGATILSPAVEHRNGELIDLLITHGADVNAKTHWWAGGFTLLEMADERIVPFLLERGARMNVHAAAKLGWTADLERLIREDPSRVYEPGGDGKTPLHYASTVEVAALLLDHGADVNALDVDHESTPAMHLIREHQDVVRYLVSRGARTDILMAAALGDLALVEGHLARDPRAIRMAVTEAWFPKGSERAGGTIYIWTLGHHKTPHTAARDFGHEDVFQALMRHTPPALALAMACELGDEEMFTTMLKTKPAIAQTLTADERAKLAAAAMNDNANAVRRMLEAGWPADVADQVGATPLHWAAWHGNADMVRALLSHHPPLEVRDPNNNVTPLSWAFHGSENGWHRDTGDYGAVVNALLDAGARMPTASGPLEASEAVLRELAKRGLVT